MSVACSGKRGDAEWQARKGPRPPVSLRCSPCGPAKLPRARAVQQGGHWPQATVKSHGEHSPSRRLWWLGSLVSVPPWTRLQSDDDIQLFLPSPLLSSVLQIQQVLPMGRHCPRPELWPLPRLMLWSWLAVACPQVPVGWADLGPHLHWLYSQASLQDHM